MSEKKTAVPIYGTYQAPDGRVHELRAPEDVYAVFSELLKRMPGFEHWAKSRPTVVFRKQDPSKRYLVGPAGGWMPTGVRGAMVKQGGRA